MQLEKHKNRDEKLPRVFCARQEADLLLPEEEAKIGGRRNVTSLTDFKEAIVVSLPACSMVVFIYSRQKRVGL